MTTGERIDREKLKEQIRKASSELGIPVNDSYMGDDSDIEQMVLCGLFGLSNKTFETLRSTDRQNFAHLIDYAIALIARVADAQGG